MNNDFAEILVAAEHGKLILVKDYVASGKTVNGVKVKVEFRTSDWDDMIKTVSFFRESDSYGQLLDEDGSCFVPWEVLDTLEHGKYQIGLIGISGSTHLTTNKIELKFNDGLEINSETSDPTPTLKEQTTKILKQISDLTEEEIEDELLSLLDDIATIKLAVDHGKLIIVKDYQVPAKTINGARVSIEFRSKDWENMAKTVTFFRDQKSYGIPLPTGKTSCYVPWEILDELYHGTYEVGVFGVNENARLVTNRVKLIIPRGSYGEGEESKEPTADVYSQLADIINKKQDALIAGENISIENNVISAAGVSEEFVEEIIEEQLIPYATKSFVEEYTSDKADKVYVDSMWDSINDSLDNTWVGTLSEYEIAKKNGEIKVDTICAIIDDEDEIFVDGETHGNVFTYEEKIKLAGIQIGAEENVNADWHAIDGDAFILNKPTNLSQFNDDLGIPDVVKEITPEDVNKWNSGTEVLGTIDILNICI